MGLGKKVEKLAQVFEKEGGIGGGALVKPVDDRTKCPLSSSKPNEIL